MHGQTDTDRQREAEHLPPGPCGDRFSSSSRRVSGATLLGCGDPTLRGRSVSREQSQNTPTWCFPTPSWGHTSSGGGCVQGGDTRALTALGPVELPALNQTRCGGREGRALLVPHPQLPCPGRPGRKGAGMVLPTPKERDGFPPHLAVVNRETRQQKDTFPFPPKNGNH